MDDVTTLRPQHKMEIRQVCILWANKPTTLKDNNRALSLLDFRSKNLAIWGAISGAEIFFGLFCVNVLGKNWDHVCGYFFQIIFLSLKYRFAFQCMIYKCTI